MASQASLRPISPPNPAKVIDTDLPKARTDPLTMPTPRVVNKTLSL